VCPRLQLHETARAVRIAGWPNGTRLRRRIAVANSPGPAVKSLVPDELRPLRRAGAPTEPHLTEREIAAYLDAVVDPAERGRIEAHLVRCDPCLDEVIAALVVTSRARTISASRPAPG
jgi:hypothetical protein